MAWFFLLIAGLCEIAWAIGLKYTEGFSRLLPSIGTVAAMVASIGLLGLALKSLPVGTAYGVWTGLGAAGTTALGIYLFNEPATLLRLAYMNAVTVPNGGAAIQFRTFKPSIISPQRDQSSAGGRCASGTTTRSRRTAVSRLIPTPTWKSSPMSATVQ